MKGVSLVWPGGEHSFLLNIDHLKALQQKCDAGPGFILGRLQTGSWHVEDVLETIRLGLIGGGMGTAAARELVDRAVIGEPLAKFVITATLVLASAIVGADEEDNAPGEADAGGVTEENPSRAENGDLPTSTSPPAS